MPASSPNGEVRRSRQRTLAALVLIAYARLLIAVVPLRLWRDRLGWSGRAAGKRGDETRTARRLAHHVERAARLFPAPPKCLPRAMALSLLLRRARIAHRLVIAARPRARRSGADSLHAWIEREDERLIGDLPGPWIEVLRLGGVPE